MVSKAKYEAWYKFHQMPKHQAMIRYLEVVSILKDEHFRSANLDGGIVASSSYFSSTNEDIVYSDDDEEEVYDEIPDTATRKQGEKSGMGLRPSTLFCDAKRFDESRESEQESLFDLVEQNDLEKLTSLLQSSSGSRDLVNQTDSSGQTPLHIAVDLGHRNCVDLLLLHGANPNSVDNDGTSVLQTAVMSSFCPDLDSFSDVASADYSNVAVGDFRQLLISLLEAGADPDIADSDGATARSTAVSEGKEWILNLIHNCSGTNPNK
jgi:hypothetical protein